MTIERNAFPASGPEHQQYIPPAKKSIGVRIIVWIILLLIFAGGFALVLRRRDDTAKTARAPRGGGGPVTVTTATATKGDIGFYLDSIGTVTPVYTSSITSQVNGIVTAVHYREGQIADYAAVRPATIGIAPYSVHDGFGAIDRSARRWLGCVAVADACSGLAESF